MATDPEVIRRLTTVEQQAEDAVQPEITVDLISPFLALPGLRGFWPMSSFDENGDAFDMSEQDRTLTNNHVSLYSYDGLVPYVEFDGTNDYLSRADEAGLDILGTEAYVAAAAQGLTVGGWFKFDALDASNEQLISKLQAGVSGAYYLWRLAGTTAVRFSVNSGAADGISTVILDTTNWFFCAGRFVPSTSVDVYVNGTKNSDLAGIPAAILNLGHNLTVGADTVGAEPFDGRASVCFLCSAAVSDAMISSLFESTKAAFGVE